MVDSLQKLAELVARGLRPVIDLLTTGPDSGQILLRQLGFLTDPVPPILETLPAAAVGLDIALRKLSAARADGTSSDEDAAIAEVFAAVVAVAASVKTIAAAVPTLPGFEDRFYELVLVLATEALRPTLAYLLYLLGIFTRSIGTIVVDGENQEVIIRSVQFDHVGVAFTRPQDLFHDVYGWGTNSIDTTKLFANIANLAGFLGLPFRIEYPADEALTAFGAQILDDSLLPRQLAVPLGTFEEGEIDIDVFALPTASPTEVQALAFVLELTGDGARTLDISGQTTLTISATGGVQSGIGMIWRPGNLPQITGNVLGSAGAAIAQGSVAVTLTRTGFVPVDSDHAEEQTLAAVGGSTLTAQSIEIGGTVAVGSHPDLTFEAAIIGGKASISVGGGDGFLTSVFPSSPVEAHFDARFVWSQSTGVHFGVSGGLELTIPAEIDIGPLTIDAIHLKGDIGGQLALRLTIDATVEIGPVEVSVGDVGAQISLQFARGNLGIFDASAAFAPPKSLGIAVNAGSIAGGGFISLKDNRYSGILNLKIYSVNVTAFGIIDTKLPDGSKGFSFVIVISAEFTPIQLGFGFMLLGVGGVLGINRSFDQDGLRKALNDGGLENILFPHNVVERAPEIIGSLQSILPPVEGKYVFGPLAKLTWLELIDGEIGIILEFPGLVVTLLGEVRCNLPDPDDALVSLNMAITGRLDFPAKSMAMDAKLSESRIGEFPIHGSMAMRLRWGDDPVFVLAMGGFHPAFQPPPDFPKLELMTVDIGSDGNPAIQLAGFFAITSNTVQVGGALTVHASGDGVTLDAMLSAKALFVFSPFHFDADISASVRVGFHGYGIGVHLHAQLTGPSPWRLQGEACVSVLWWDACLNVNHTFGGGTPVQAPTIDPWKGVDSNGNEVIVGLSKAIGDPRNWTPLPPARAFQVVSLSELPADDKTNSAPSAARFDPIGKPQLRQHVLPVETLDAKISHIGAALSSGPDHFTLTSATIGSTTKQELKKSTSDDVKDSFAQAQYFDLTDAQKLSAPSFTKYVAGYTFDADATASVAGSVGTATVQYETFVSDSRPTPEPPPPTPPPPSTYLLPPDHLSALSLRAVTERFGLSQAGTALFIGRAFTKLFRIADPRFLLTNKVDLTLAPIMAVAASQAEAMLALDAHVVANPAAIGLLQVTPAYLVEQSP